jgi:hypothetical protein
MYQAALPVNAATHNITNSAAKELMWLMIPLQLLSDEFLSERDLFSGFVMILEDRDEFSSGKEFFFRFCENCDDYSSRRKLFQSDDFGRLWKIVMILDDCDDCGRL